MKQYQDLMRHVLENGTDKTYRKGIGRRSVFGYQMRFDLSKGFPLVTTKKVHLRSIIVELLWFLTGSTNAKDLQKEHVTIWDEWADENGELGPIYGKQWTAWESANGKKINQIQQAQDLIMNDPNSTRIIVSGWNVGDIEELILSHKLSPPPCHTLFQFYVANGKLSCQLYQRSVDIFLGLPFNIASYALLTMMMAKVTGLELGEFVHTSGDAHIYHNHFDQVKEQLTREPRSLPKMIIKGDQKSIFDFKFEDFELTDYNPHPAIKGQVSI